jgi:hypothetical protein
LFRLFSVDMKQIVNQREKGLDVIRRLAAAAMLLALFQAGTAIGASAAETIRPGRNCRPGPHCRKGFSHGPAAE